MTDPRAADPRAADSRRSARDSEVAEHVARVTGDESSRVERAGALLGLSRALATSARAAGAAAFTTGRWLTDIVVDIAPRIPVRDLETLRAHHGNRSGSELADALVRSAARATAGIGAAGGAIAAAEWEAPPALLGVPLQLAAETLAVVAVEVKLVAELHEVYGASVAGTGTERARAYLTAWARQRAADPKNSAGLLGAFSSAARREVRSRIVRRFGRSVTTLAPFLAGAVAGGALNHRATEQLGQAIQRDLLRRR